MRQKRTDDEPGIHCIDDSVPGHGPGIGLRVLHEAGHAGALAEGAAGLRRGAMLYVVVEELVPDYSQGKHSNIGTIGFALGFAMMMVLDVTLG